MLDKLDAIQDRFNRLEEQMADPNVLADMERYRKVSREYKELKEIVTVANAYRLVMSNLASAKQMLKDPDAEMREMAELELEELNPQKEELEEQLKTLLMPKDPEDAKDVIVEIRSGTGGDEASLFAGDLYRMYSRFFDEQGWEVEVLEVNEGTVGGYSKLVLEIRGENVYGKLKFESGAHRVQRVPKTESQGRVHTSAATVAVMPKLEMEDVNINRSDLKIDTFRASGAGGQHINKTESAIRITHIPTGIVSESQDGRSQHQNKEIALQKLYQRIYEAQQRQHISEIAAKRKSLVGSGDRSEKIRTYNFPQNRVTDHRLEGDAKNYNLDTIIEGDLNELLEALQIAENAEKLKAREEEIA
ncbi:MAG: peptide chain release factor 1 [Saprospiraceae bacterium]|nr:peptide chain release factor 1 [Saprospiraceae bacterium]